MENKVININGQDVKLESGMQIFFYTPFRWTDLMSWLASAIRYFAKIKYNHASTVVCNWFVPFVNEAVASGVNPTNCADRLKGRQILIRRFKGGLPYTERDFCIRANEKLGDTKYDYKGLVFYQLVFQLFHVWLKRKREYVERHMYCYDYNAYCYQEYYGPEWWNINPSAMLSDDRFETVFEGVWEY